MTIVPRADGRDDEEIRKVLAGLSIDELKSQARANFVAYDAGHRTSDSALRFGRLVSAECFRRIDEVIVSIADLRNSLVSRV